ncbi:MAG TPA: GPP34 family phosphoprotein [Anaerolineaceae bacterium]|nr:GPP34 family phosphoprotein [Anaerolineaceae bacterium]
MLTLAEELFLLTMNEKKSSVAVSSAQALPAALVGAMLLDLIIEGKIELIDGERVGLAKGVPSENKYLNHILEKITTARKPKKLLYWTEAFSLKPKKLEKELVKSLIAKKILKIKKKKLIWVIPFIDYSQEDASAKFWRKRHLRAIILAGEKVDPQSAALLSLLKACGLLDHLFTIDEIKYAGNRAEELFIDQSLDPVYIEMIKRVSAIAASVIESNELT